MLEKARDLGRSLGGLRFSPPVTHVYNPLDYAWAGHEQYLRKFASGRKRVLFLGMNPGPFGMAQTGVPFGEIAAVQQWLGIKAEVKKPLNEHPRRPISGFDCKRSEISGQRLWGLFASRFTRAETFFQEHFVVNYCPLLFMEESGRNRTPDKLRPREKEQLFSLCNAHLRVVVQSMRPEWLVGIGKFAAERLQDIFPASSSRIVQVLHPSPASPAANRNWAELVTRQLKDQAIW